MASTRIDLYRQATIFDVTDITGSELETLSDGSVADSLHIHDLGSMTGTVSIDHNDTGAIQGGTASEYYHLTNAEHTEVTAFFASTDITGAEAETLTDGSNADALHGHAASNITYNNATSGLTATDVQAAIDELENEIDAVQAVGWKEVFEVTGDIDDGTPVTIPNSRTYYVGSDTLDVYLNGQLLTITRDYTETSSTQVTFTEDLEDDDDVIQFIHNPNRN